MGYTSYWSYSPKPTVTSKDPIQVVIDEIKTLLKQLPKSVVLRGGDGTGEPIFTTKEICFNGDGDKGLDHETFYFKFASRKLDFAFCKTARKPYDLMVCLCLLSLKNNLPGFSFSSDGDQEDWQSAIDFYTEHVGPLNFELFEIFGEDGEKN